MIAVNINPGAPPVMGDAARPWRVAPEGKIATEGETGPVSQPIQCCGIVQLTQLSGVRTGIGAYVKDLKTGVTTYKTIQCEEAIITALRAGGFCRNHYSYSTPEPTWDSTVGYVAGICWTDAEYLGNGKWLADFFVQKGYKVQVTELGVNPRYGTKEHTLTHYIAFTGPKGLIGEKAALAQSLIREYGYELQQEKQISRETTPESTRNGFRRSPGIRKFGRVAGAGVRAFRTGRPPRTLVR